MDWARRKSPTAFSVVVPGATPTRLPARSPTVRMSGPLGDQQACAVHERHEREVDLLLPGERRGRGAALDVDRAVGHRVHAVLGSDGDPAHRQVRELELLLDGDGDLLAEVDRVAGGLAVRAGVGEGEGVLPIADRQGAAVADLLQRARERLGMNRSWPRGPSSSPERSSRVAALEPPRLDRSELALIGARSLSAGADAVKRATDDEDPSGREGRGVSPSRGHRSRSSSSRRSRSSAGPGARGSAAPRACPARR